MLIAKTGRLRLHVLVKTVGEEMESLVKILTNVLSIPLATRMLTVQILTVLLFVPVMMVIKEAGTLVPLSITVPMIIIHAIRTPTVLVVKRVLAVLVKMVIQEMDRTVMILTNAFWIRLHVMKMPLVLTRMAVLLVPVIQVIVGTELAVWQTTFVLTKIILVIPTLIAQTGRLKLHVLVKTVGVEMVSHAKILTNV